MAFVDLAGYTRLTEERGDRAAAELASTMSDVVRETVTHHAGRAVKWLGDGVMLHFAAPPEAVHACLELVDALPAAGLPEGHAGVSAGPVVTQDGDYYGRTVNLAARISSKAASGEVLVDEQVVTLASDAGLKFDHAGVFELKGFAQPMALHRAASAAAKRTKPHEGRDHSEGQ
jgi:class 3 adenylate cyclase